MTSDLTLADYLGRDPPDFERDPPRSGPPSPQALAEADGVFIAALVLRVGSIHLLQQAGLNMITPPSNDGSVWRREKADKLDSRNTRTTQTGERFTKSNTASQSYVQM